jgi:hypothetical protein
MSITALSTPSQIKCADLKERGLGNQNQLF